MSNFYLGWSVSFHHKVNLNNLMVTENMYLFHEQDYKMSETLFHIQANKRQSG